MNATRHERRPKRVTPARFAALANRLELDPGAPALFEKLAAAYAETARHYHTTEHLEACLHHLDSVRPGIPRADEVELALWFHDAVYVPGSTTNERDSAEWLASFAEQAGAGDALRQRLEALVMVTVHPSLPTDDDQRWLVDIDLSILGQPVSVYERFEANIRAEYAFVPESEFRPRRRALLEGFLAAPCIYHTDHFARMLDTQARTNLRAAITALA